MALLAACGQKGPLYLPEPVPPPAARQAVPGAPPAAASAPVAPR